MGDTPNWLVCPVARRNRTYAMIANGDYPSGHRLRRTGRIKPNSNRRRGNRTLDEKHEIVCTCGYRGWTVHFDVLNRPLQEN